MTAVMLSRPLKTAGSRVRVVGDIPVLMRDFVDERQLWLPFVRVMVCVREGVGKAMTPPKERDVQYVLRKRAEFTHAAVPTVCQRMFVHEQGLHQRGLPFPGFRSVGRTESRLIEKAGFPGWERNDEDRVASFEFHPGLRGRMLEWCDENCKGRYLVRQGQATFENWFEAVLARLSV